MRVYTRIVSKKQEARSCQLPEAEVLVLRNYNCVVGTHVCCLVF